MESPLDEVSEGNLHFTKTHSVAGILSTILFIVYFIINFGFPFLIKKQTWEISQLMIKLFFYSGFINVMGIGLGVIGLTYKLDKRTFIKIAFWCHGFELGLILLSLLAIWLMDNKYLFR